MSSWLKEKFFNFIVYMQQPVEIFQKAQFNFLCRIQANFQQAKNLFFYYTIVLNTFVIV